jgi:Pyruvate/2-oxoacid:ferredoxin oxidoreductase delta subunit
METALLGIAIFAIVLLFALIALWIFGERGHLILPSTLRAARPKRGKRSGTPSGRKPSLLDTLHAYVYGRWTNQYIYVLINWVMPRLDARGRQDHADTYHGKVLTPEHAAEIVTLDHDVNVRNAEHIVPYPIARDIVLQSPLAITLYECACRHARPNGGCKPTDVCMVIGEGGNFQVEHNPHSARRITQAEALDILRAEHERGHVHSAWFKDALGNRMYAICNCCKCCCGGIEAMMKYGARSMVSSGFVAAIDTSNCTACGACVDACPFEAMTLNDSVASVNRAKCMGCGVCQTQCVSEAIALMRDETKPAPLDVRVLV